MSGELAFFELGVGDTARGRAFYEGLFGWRFSPGPSGGDGYLIETPTVPGGMHGRDPGAGPYVFFRVDDIEASVERVRELGGEVDDMDAEGEKDSQSQLGRFTVCRDDQGSPFGLFQAPASGS